MGEKEKEPRPQKRIQDFFEKKTKAQKSKAQGLGDGQTDNMGATTSSPFIGVSGSPAFRAPSKEGRGPIPEVRGGGELEGGDNMWA